MKVLGINAFHADSSAALIQDGRLVAAVEEERFRRIKHWAGFPRESIRYCLAAGNLTLSDVDIIAVNSDAKAHRLRKLAYVLSHQPSPRLILQRLRNRKHRSNIISLLHGLDGNFNGLVVSVEHHLAHLSSAFHVSPFAEAVVVSVDGFGDFASSAWGLGAGTDIRIDGRIYFPHSLGIFYEALTQYLGFRHYGDEYKVMGLAPYGEPVYLQQMQSIVRLLDDGGYALDLDYFRHAREQVGYTWNETAPEVDDLFTDKLCQLFGPMRSADTALTQHHKNIAASVQAMYEHAFFHLLNALHKKYMLPHLALAGGCAMNSVANGKIYRNTPFRKVYVQAAAGDAGGAIGAALTAAFQYGLHRNEEGVMKHAYLGPEYSNASIRTVLDAHRDKLAAQNCHVEVQETEALIQNTAAHIAAGKVVGWFCGRMEWGPRALGHRSIVCDPRRADMKDILNQKIKRRESFRPFAPSVLREAVNDWFETDDDVPFMLQVYKIREQQRKRIPAVTHVDGSGRLQTVTREDNGTYYRLIKAFAAISGIPMVLNTSFNENEPIVCKPEEALDCFLRTRMDVLVLENYMITRPG